MTPSLQNPYMLAHPPLLYLGYVGLTVPFAFAMGALLSGRLDERWLIATRRWTLFAWAALGVGQLLGSHWAYVEVGWGGYYAWDPVENAALMPWLAATAFLHSVMIQEKRGMLKVWNVLLVILAFSLSLFGTFLTRSGVVNSIHSFTQSSIGPWFLAFIVLTVAVSHRDRASGACRSFGRRRSSSRPISREAAFLYNNLLLLALCLAILWGVVYPVLSEAVRGEAVVLGPLVLRLLPARVRLAALAAHGHRAAHRLEARLAEEPRDDLPLADARRARGRRRVVAPRCGQLDAGSRRVHVLGVRARDHRDGVRARDARAQGARRALVAERLLVASSRGTAAATAGTSSMQRSSSSRSAWPGRARSTPSRRQSWRRATRCGSATTRSSTARSTSVRRRTRRRSARRSASSVATAISERSRPARTPTRSSSRSRTRSGFGAIGSRARTSSSSPSRSIRTGASTSASS